MVSEPLQKTFLREKSELKLREKEEVRLQPSLEMNTLTFVNRSIYCSPPLYIVFIFRRRPRGVEG